MQVAIAQQLGLDISTVGNFFMNARRRSQDKWIDDDNEAADELFAELSATHAEENGISDDAFGQLAMCETLGTSRKSRVKSKPRKIKQVNNCEENNESANIENKSHDEERLRNNEVYSAAADCGESG